MHLKKHFHFGETVKGYEVPIFNEREIRAAAGILFLFAFIAFMNAFLLGDFTFVKIFIVAFFTDFFIRLFVNPMYAPSMILGRIFIRHQKPEYSGAPQKKFAWSIGLTLSVVMFVRIVLLGSVGPINLLICVLCLAFLFFEAVFGICLGCLVYQKLFPDKVKYCPGGVCEIRRTEPIQKVLPIHIVILIIFLVGIAATGFYFLNGRVPYTSDQDAPCIVPQWAKDIGHERIYRMHHCR